MLTTTHSFLKYNQSNYTFFNIPHRSCRRKNNAPPPRSRWGRSHNNGSHLVARLNRHSHIHQFPCLVYVPYYIFYYFFHRPYNQQDDNHSRRHLLLYRIQDTAVPPPPSVSSPPFFSCIFQNCVILHYNKTAGI